MELYAPPPGFVPTYTWANKPATYPTGQPVFISNVGKGALCYYDGTPWRRVNGIANLKTLDASTGNIDNNETLAVQYLMPAAFLSVGDRIRIRGTFTKSGTTDTGTFNIRIGTAGTTSDDLINPSAATILNAAGLNYGFDVDVRFESATLARTMGVNNAQNAIGYAAVVNNAQAAGVVISNISNALYVSLFIKSSSTNNTVALSDAQIDVVDSAA